MLNAFLFIVFITFGYLVGSVCSAIIVAKIFDLPDPCREGSKNPGATNVLRLSGKKYAIYVLIADMLKGFLPVLIVLLITSNMMIAALTGFAAIVGHCYPLFFKFKGGKGVATTLGSLLALDLALGASVIGMWLLVVNITRFSSLASMISVAVAPILSLFFLQKSDPLVPLIAIAFLVFYKHRENINRLIEGTESKVVLKKPTPPEKNQSSEDSSATHQDTLPTESIIDVVREDTQNKTTNND